MPKVNLTGSGNRFEGAVALSIRYIIINDKVFKDKQRAKEKEKRIRLKELGIEYDFPGFASFGSAGASYRPVIL